MLMQSPKLNFISAFLHIKYHLFLLLLPCIICSTTHAQDDVRLRVYNSYDGQKLYNNDTILHTVWKPVIYTDSLLPVQNSRWFKRKFFQEHLLQVQTPGFNIYGDIIVDEYTGVSSRYKKTLGSKIINTKTPGMDTRGYEVSGNMGNKFYFETNFYENQARFGGYIDSFIRQYKVIPGQGSYKNLGDGTGFDFSYSSARLTYIPNKNLLFDLGYGKNFIGDGYRSLLLSDWSFNYPYLRASFTFNKFQYSVMWSQYISAVGPNLANSLGYFRKWAQTYVVDWKATKNMSLSLFESVIWPDQIHGTIREKDVSPWLLNPLIFAHSSTSPSGVSNNDIVGFNAKYKIVAHTFFYGQYVINELGQSSSWQNRTGYQLGIRSGSIFGAKDLNVDVEFNTVRPYTYQGNSNDVNYTNNNQPLAHPLGANFKEGLFVSNYTCNRFWFRVEAFFAHYGADTGSSNYGHNIFLPLSTNLVADNVSTGQGIPAKIYFGDIKIAYIINPVTNLRVETGFTYRRESSSYFVYTDKIFYIGIRMSFRNLLYDF